MDAAIQILIEQVRAAAADQRRLRVRGGGTKDFYGEPSQGEPLDTRALSGVLSYEPSELVVTVGAGTPQRELEALLAERGQCLPFEPPRFADADGGAGAGTVGGMVAAGLSGPARASVGAVRDYVLGARLINGRAQLLTFGGQVMKNVAGYDVSRVLAGSLGTLGVITELSLKVLPVAPSEASLRFECTQADALRLLNAWGGEPLPLNASRWEAQAGGTLVLRLRGAAAAVTAACTRLGGERLPEAEAQVLWERWRDLHELIEPEPQAGDQALWRVSVPQTAPVLDLPGKPVIEWHGGQRWYRAPASAFEAMRQAARSVGGHATLFHAGADGAPGVPRFDVLAPAIRRVHEALQREFDPHGVFDHARLLSPN